MSGSAAIASAQRRRAGGAQAPQRNSKFSRYRSNEPETAVESPVQKMHIRDVLAVFAARIDSLKGSTDAHSEHWDEHDAFLKEVCDRIDALEERLNRLESSKTQEN